MKFADLGARTVTAVVVIGMLFILEILSSHTVSIGSRQISLSILFPAVACFLVAGCSTEYVRLCGAHGQERFDKLLYFMVTAGPSTLLFFLFYFFPSMALDTPSSVFILGFLGVVVSLIGISLGGRESLEVAKERAFELLVGSMLLGFGGVGLVCLALHQSHSLLFWMCSVVIANDVGAYFFGKFLGRHKLSWAISPGKSIEGGLGGLMCGVIVGALLTPVPALKSAFLVLAVMSVSIGIMGQLFDLTKSLMKRIAGVKDSGSLLPGHGGLLDRLDGILGGALGLQAILLVILSS